MLTLYLGTTSRLLVFGKTRTYHCFNGTRTKVMKLKRCLFQLANREAPLPRDFPLLYQCGTHKKTARWRDSDDVSRFETRLRMKFHPPLQLVYITTVSESNQKCLINEIFCGFSNTVKKAAIFLLTYDLRKPLCYFFCLQKVSVNRKPKKPKGVIFQPSKAAEKKVWDVVCKWTTSYEN